MYVPDIFATHQLIERRLPVVEHGVGSALGTGWGDAPDQSMGDAPKSKTGMGGKPETGMGSKPSKGTGEKPKKKLGKKLNQGTGEKPRGFCKDCPIPNRTAEPNNEIANSTTTTSGGYPADRAMVSTGRKGSMVKSPTGGGDERILAADGRSWTKRARSDAAKSDEEGRVMASDGRSWVKREDQTVSIASSRTMKSDSQRWGRREAVLQPRETVSRSDEPESKSTPEFLSNDFDWSRRSPGVVNFAKTMERANAVDKQPADADGFITVDKHFIPAPESTPFDLAERDHSDILWEFIPEGQSRVGSTVKS
ncbi:hypothetical protein QFC21_001621 [Naganishia friedmannii]|uniref:Uncharacterized protein n=1 Tax=Naganishia friedmannii TaxID=89922 RepID=A0ACC2W2B7_9TREE|nr:hypothetical protein QFC21_001621 [Naganishia friedmannii]